MFVVSLDRKKVRKKKLEVEVVMVTVIPVGEIQTSHLIFPY